MSGLWKHLGRGEDADTGPDHEKIDRERRAAASAKAMAEVDAQLDARRQLAAERAAEIDALLTGGRVTAIGTVSSWEELRTAAREAGPSKRKSPAHRAKEVVGELTAWVQNRGPGEPMPPLPDVVA